MSEFHRLIDEGTMSQHHLDPGKSSRKLEDLLECPICMSFMYSHIYQCPNGHVLCSNCKRNIKDCCPTCRGSIGDIRCLILEEVAGFLEFPCNYRESGCSRLVKYQSKQEHEDKCRYRPYKCPFPSSPPCAETGTVAALVSHLKSVHQSDVKNGGKIDTVFTLGLDKGVIKALCKVVVYEHCGERFCLHIVVGRRIDFVYVYLTFMGEEADAGDFQYELEIGNDERRITWKENPRSIREGAEHIRESYDGLTFHRNLAKSLAEKNNIDYLNLRVRGSIRKKGNRHDSFLVQEIASTVKERSPVNDEGMDIDECDDRNVMPSKMQPDKMRDRNVIRVKPKMGMLYDIDSQIVSLPMRPAMHVGGSRSNFESNFACSPKQLS